MISATAFATRFTSFWLECLGPLGYFFVQHANRTSTPIFPPLASVSDLRLHSGMSEAASQLFEASLSVPGLLQNKRRALRTLRVILANRSGFDRNALNVEMTPPVLGPAEEDEVLKIARRLRAFIDQYSRGRSIIPSPRFPGCGFIDASCGDFLLGDTLYEIKAAEPAERKSPGDDAGPNSKRRRARPPFLLVNFRQLLVYLALNASSKSYDIKYIGLLNIRTGHHFKVSLEVFVRSISGKHSSELFAELLDFISGGGVSR